MIYTIENGIVYANESTASGGTAKRCIGNEKQYSTTKSDMQIIYQWQKFNASKGVYEDDTTNATAIDGVTPTNGKVAITVTPHDAMPTFEDKVNYLYYKATGVIS